MGTKLKKEMTLEDLEKSIDKAFAKEFGPVNKKNKKIRSSKNKR